MRPTVVASRSPAPGALRVRHELGPVSIDYVLDDGGIARCSVGPDLDAPAPDAAIHRDVRTELCDLGPESGRFGVASRTVLDVGTGPVRPWGLPDRVRFPPGLVPADVRTKLVVEATHGPFARRMIAIELTVTESGLRSSVSATPADAALRCSWSAFVTWACTPEALFTDVFPGGLRVTGDLAALSLVDGALAHVSPTPVSSVLRWGDLWGSGPVRRDLAGLRGAVAAWLRATG